MPGFIVHAERKGLNGSFRYGHAFFLRTCLMSSASGWTLRTGSKDKETPGVQERRLSGKDIRFLYMALLVVGAWCMACPDIGHSAGACPVSWMLCHQT